MSAKASAAYHGRDIVDRLRTTAPYTEDGPTMRDAADEIERLQGEAAQVVEVHHHDIERHAESFNEGYNTAMAQQLMSDDELHNGDCAEVWLKAKVDQAALAALLGAAKEARIRGDIGKPGCVEVWDWLEYWAGREYK